MLRRRFVRIRNASGASARLPVLVPNEFPVVRDHRRARGSLPALKIGDICETDFETRSHLPLSKTSGQPPLFHFSGRWSDPRSAFGAMRHCDFAPGLHLGRQRAAKFEAFSTGVAFERRQARRNRRPLSRRHFCDIATQESNAARALTPGGEGDAFLAPGYPRPRMTPSPVRERLLVATCRGLLLCEALLIGKVQDL
jgi:hypothetical protein